MRTAISQNLHSAGRQRLRWPGQPQRPARCAGERPPQRGVSAPLTALLAVTSGAAVANLYYVQPLLERIAHALGVTHAAAGLLVTATQVGYVAGLALLVPLGDLLERRRLIATLLVCAAGGLVACAAAPSFPVLVLALLGVGTTSVVAQLVVALASGLAGPHARGRVVGAVMSGLLIGILTARTLSGILAAIGGWRLSFALAAGAMVALAATLRRALPLAPPVERIAYRKALRSVLSLVASEPLLRQRMLLGGLGFAGFSVLWTSLAFLLAGPPFHYGAAVIGLFGLAGAAGALAAPVAGRIADRGHGTIAQSGFLACLLASWGLLALGRHSLAPVIAGIVLLDLGVQGAHIGNQTTIYSLHPEARGRLTTAYMVSVFTGGIAGSTLSASIYSSGGWTGVCALGTAIAATALVAWTIAARRGSPRTKPHEPTALAHPSPQYRTSRSTRAPMIATSYLRAARQRLETLLATDPRCPRSESRARLCHQATGPSRSTNWPLGPSSGTHAISTAIRAPSAAVIGAAARLSGPPRSVCSQPGQTELTLIGVSLSTFASAIVSALSAAFDPW